jgi:hypothetical protein
MKEQSLKQLIIVILGILLAFTTPIAQWIHNISQHFFPANPVYAAFLIEAIIVIVLFFSPNPILGGWWALSMGMRIYMADAFQSFYIYAYNG